MADSISFLLSLTPLLLLLLLIHPSSSSLPTVSISPISPNHTLICALTKSQSQSQPQTQLNCTLSGPNPSSNSTSISNPSSSSTSISIPSSNSASISLNRFLISASRFSFVGIVGGSQFLCGLSSPFPNSPSTSIPTSSIPTSSIPTSSFLVCWRFINGSMEFDQFKRVYFGPVLGSIDSGDSHVCGIVNPGNPGGNSGANSGVSRLLCWQWDQFNDNSVLNRTEFASGVSVGENFVCGLSEFGRIRCRFGDDSVDGFNISNNVPVGNYSVVSAGYSRVCGVNSSSGLDCWGERMIGKPEGLFRSVSVGDGRFCAIRVNGTVVCWGDGGFRLPESLESVSFEELEVNRGVFCGISSSNYELYCWGNEFLNSILVGNVVPGLCTTSCACGPIPNYESFCSSGLMICRPCRPQSARPAPPPTSSVTPQLSPRNAGWSDKMIAFVVVGSAGSLSFLLVICFVILRFCKSSEGSRVHDSGPMEDAQIASQTGATSRILVKKLSHLISMGNGSHLEEFTLQTIINATDNFSDDHRIGVGSFGSVYRGILTDGRKVAVKRAELTSTSSYPGGMNKHQEDTNNAFVNELEFLSRVNHKNLVRLLGFCEEETELILVYEFMENGSLHSHLHNLYSSYIMSWPARIKVALDAARGLEYLHVYADPPIIHRDIKSSNILLDDDWTGKVSDFGLSLMGPSDNKSHLSLRAAGTVGYMDPEYYKFEQLNAKSDVYSFGVVLLELLSGYRAIHKNEVGERRNVVDSVVPYIVRDDIHRILDPKVPPPTPFEIEAVKYVGYLAVDCVTLEGRDRPTMSELVTCLDRALNACLTIPSFSHSSNNSTRPIDIEVDID